MPVWHLRQNIQRSAIVVWNLFGLRTTPHAANHTPRRLIVSNTTRSDVTRRKIKQKFHINNLSSEILPSSPPCRTTYFNQNHTLSNTYIYFTLTYRKQSLFRSAVHVCRRQWPKPFNYGKRNRYLCSCTRN